MMSRAAYLSKVQSTEVQKYPSRITCWPFALRLDADLHPV